MRAGRLRHRLVIQDPVEPQNSHGEVISQWKPIATVWGSVEPLQGRERFTAQQVVPEVTHTIRMRYRDLNSKQRIAFGERMFNIESILNRDERNIELTVLAVEEP